MTTMHLPLLVPVQVDALVVNASDRRATKWSVSSRTYAGAGQHLPLDPPPFATGNDRPRVGVTLHWLLPDALTVGRWHDGADGQPELLYPHLPDRWLVVRTTRAEGSTDPPIASPQAWVIESNYAGADGTNPFPLPGGGLDYLGRSSTLSAWPSNAETTASRVIVVTTLGPTTPVAGGREIVYDVDPSYAASVANVDNVFAFHDDLGDLDSDDDPQAVLSYAVVGWYSNPDAGDPMVNQTRLGRELATRLGANPDGVVLDDWRLVMDTLGWSVGDDNDLRQAQLSATDAPSGAHQLVPTRTICHGMVYGVRWLGFNGAPQPFTAGHDSAFSGSAIRSRTGWRNPVLGTADGEFGDIENGPSGGDAASLRQPGGATSAAGHRSRFPHVAIGASTTDALAALFEFLLGHEDGGSDVSDLATLFQALEHDLLDVYESPGGAAELGRRLHQDGFVPHPGEGQWDIVLRRPGDGTDDAAAVQEPHIAPEGIHLLRAIDAVDPTIQLESLLSNLNDLRRQLDASERTLRADRRELYAVWWKSARQRQPNATADAAVPSLAASGGRLDALKTITQTSSDNRDLHKTGLEKDRSTLDSLLDSTAIEDALVEVLGDNPQAWLELVDSPAARFFAPADPVVVIAGGRASGKYRRDETLLVRFGRAVQDAPGQTLRYRIDDTTSIGAADIVGPFFGDLLDGKAVPDVAGALLAELLLLDAGRIDTDDADDGWSGHLWSVAQPNANNAEVAATMRDHQRALWLAPTEEQGSIAAVTRDAGFIGVRPSPVGVEVWSQPWRPLYLAWRTTWYPSNEIEDSALEHWSFDGEDYWWRGLSDFDHATAQTVQGRCLLGGTSTRALRDAVDAIGDRLANAAVDPQETSAEEEARRHRLATTQAVLGRVKERLGSADLLAQAMTGFHDQLIQRDPTQFYEPDDQGVVNLLGDVERVAPMPYGGNLDAARFFPTRGGHARVQRLWLVDAFGQVFDVIHEQGQTDASFVPLRGRGMATVGTTQRADTQMLQFGPRLIQPSRLVFRFDFPVAGWILPNHLDNSLTVYDADGNAIGVLLLWHEAAGPSSVRWEPPPGGTGASTPDMIADARLKKMVQRLDGADREAFVGFMQAVDRTLWTIDPLGRRGDNLSVLVGRPIAVVAAKLAIELDGPARPDQLWEHTVTDVGHDDRAGGVMGLTVPVRLGLPESRDDGTIGYFLEGANRFHSVLSKVDTPSDYIVESDPSVWPRLPVRVTGATDPPPVDITLLVDPRGSINASTGLQPSKSLRLPRSFVDTPVAKMDASFRVGPILSGRSIRMPLPADIANGWSWIEKTGVEFTTDGKTETWGSPTEVEAAALGAHLSDAPTRLREGWLRLSQVVTETPCEGE